MKNDRRMYLLGHASLGMTMVLAALLALGTGCRPQTRAQQAERAERAFMKAFEKDYSDWKVTKIILTPCRGTNLYRGRFDCRARRKTNRCCTMQKGYRVCQEHHEKGAEITWSVLVTYAHGDCYYELATRRSDYE